MLEAQSLDLLVDRMEQGKAEGRTLTQYTDSSAKKHVGAFNAQGIHIGKDNPFPLPILPIEGETTEDNAMQTDMAFSLLAAVQGVEESEIYKLVDVQMTDITEHNKGFSQVLADIYSLEKPAGQLFCSSHTTLGLPRALNKVLGTVEVDTGHRAGEAGADIHGGPGCGQQVQLCGRAGPRHVLKAGGARVHREDVEPVQILYRVSRAQRGPAGAIRLQ